MDDVDDDGDEDAEDGAGSGRGEGGRTRAVGREDAVDICCEPPRVPVRVTRIALLARLNSVSRCVDTALVWRKCHSCSVVGSGTSWETRRRGVGYGATPWSSAVAVIRGDILVSSKRSHGSTLLICIAISRHATSRRGAGVFLIRQFHDGVEMWVCNPAMSSDRRLPFSDHGRSTVESSSL